MNYVVGKTAHARIMRE